MSKEIIMADATAVEGKTFSPADAPDTADAVENFLAKGPPGAVNRGGSMLSPQRLEELAREAAARSGTGDAGGESGGSGGRGRPPAPPESTPLPGDEGGESPEERLLRERERLLQEERERAQRAQAGELPERSAASRDPNMTDAEWAERERIGRVVAQRMLSGEKPTLRELQAGIRNPFMTDAEWAALQEKQRQDEAFSRAVVREEIQKREEARDWDIEYEASPERGKQIIEEIIIWEAIAKTGKDIYGNKRVMDWGRLNKAYLNQEVHIEAIRLRGVIIHEAKPPSPPSPDSFKPVEKSNLEIAGSPITTVDDLIAVYESGAYLSDPDRFFQDAGLYFKEAKNAGLFQIIDHKLAEIYRKEIREAIKQGVSSDEVMNTDPRDRTAGVAQKMQGVLDTWERLCRARMRDNPDIRLLLSVNLQTNRFNMDPRTGRVKGIGDLYVQLALERFTFAIETGDYEGLNQGAYIKDAQGAILEFELGQAEEEGEDEENYWTIEWGRYPKISAQTVEQYRRAADTYLARLQEVSTSPNELLQGSREFVEAIIRSDGFEKVQKESRGFVIKLTDQIRARVGTFGADHSIELYEPKPAKQYLDYTNEDGAGPRRYLELVKAYEGMVMATVREIDRNPMWDILFTFHGSRGQLARNFTAQYNKEEGEGVYAAALDALTEQMMGVQMINVEDNIDNVTKKLSDRRFNQMFDGLYRYGHVPAGCQMGDVHIRAYKRAYNDLKNLTPEQARAKRRQFSPEEWNSIELGRIQMEVSRLREGVKAGRKTLGRGKTVIDLLKKPDQERYKRAKRRAGQIVEIAMQLYGASGEKPKRAGGILIVQRKDGQGNNTHRDFIPVNDAERVVQFVETMTKIKYARFSAKEKMRRVKITRENTIKELQKNGYDMKFRYDDGTEIKLKRPREIADPRNLTEKDIGEDGLLRVVGNTVPEEISVDFYTAGHHPFADFDPNSYWGYQDEHRAMLLQPDTFTIARAVLDGYVSWEDADASALHLIKLDPTLRRLMPYTGGGFVEREGKLVMAAVGESTKSRLDIRTALYDAFWPELGTPTTDMNVYYGLQDFGGFFKMTQHLRARIAENPERFARRGRRLLPGLHNSMEALSDYWGEGIMGVTGVINAMDTPLQRIGGTFALGKYSAFVELANRQYEALVEGRDQEGKLLEGLLLKLTNESDTVLQEFYETIPYKDKDWTNPGKQQAFCKALRNSLQRLEIYVRLLSLESSIKNAQGMIFIEDLDIFTDEGQQLDARLEQAFARLPKVTGGRELGSKDLERLLAGGAMITEESREDVNRLFNSGTEEKPGIDEGKSSFDTGLGRYIAKEFVLRFLKLLEDTQSRGGAKLYKTEKHFYSHLHDEIIFHDPTVKGPGKAGTTIIDWLIGKMIPT